MSRPARQLLAGAVAGLLGLGSNVAHANPLDTFGFGSRATAMSGAVSADADDASANYYNPAGLARARHLGFEVSYFRAEHRLAIDGRDNHVDPVKGLNVGVVIPGTLASLPFAVGLGLHVPDDRVVRVRALPQEQPRWELYDNRNQSLYASTNVALRPWPWLEIGGGVALAASARGRLDITGSINFVKPYRSQLRNEIDADIVPVIYPQAGVRAHLGERLAFSAVYRGESSLDVAINGRLDVDVSGLTQARYALQSTSVDAFTPRNVVFGYSFAATKDLRTNLDLTWVNWAAYVSPVAKVDVSVDVPPPPSGWPASITPPTQPAPIRIVPLEMHNRVVPHLGLEWRFVHAGHWEAFFRGGYEYAKSPIPPQSGKTNFVDRDRHTFGVGLGTRIAEPLSELPGGVKLDVHFQWSQLVDAETLKEDPSDFVGDYRAGGHIFNLGGTLGVEF